MNDFLLSKKGKVQYLTIPSFTQKGIPHGFSTRAGGVSKGFFYSLNTGFLPQEDENNVYINRKIFLETLEVKGKLCSLKQAHGKEVVIVNEEHKISAGNGKNMAEGDGLVTNQRGLILSMYSADCAVLFFYDPIKRVIGLAHAGWRGTVKGIGPETVKTMQNHFQSSQKDILAGISPAVGPCCYEVEAEVVDSFSQVLEDYSSLFEARPGGKWMFNLKEANARILEKQGIKRDHITVSSHCTCCNSDLFFSYRRSRGITGRMISVISLPK